MKRSVTVDNHANKEVVILCSAKKYIFMKTSGYLRKINIVVTFALKN